MTSSPDARGREYLEAIRRKVCSVCLDSRDDLRCGLTGRSCAIEAHLPRLVEVLSRIHSPRLDDYVLALRNEICGGCRDRRADGGCELRASASCALDAYLPLVVDAIEEVHAGRAS